MTTQQGADVHINVILKRVHVTIVATGKSINITYSECVSVALVIRHAKRMRRTNRHLWRAFF
jgi:hypothetical protein